MKMSALRGAYIVYFAFLFIFLYIRNFLVGDLNLYYFTYFIEIYIALEIFFFLTAKTKYTAYLKPAYILLLFYIILNSLVLALIPQYRDLLFNRFGHFVSGIIFGVLAVVIINIMLEKTNSKLSPLAFNISVFMFASTFGVFNEIIELVLDTFTGSTRLGPTPDTAIDLLMNTLGILFFLIIKNSKQKLNKF